MHVFALRLLALGVFVGLYRLHPAIGVAALAAGWGYVFGQYRARRVPVQAREHAMNLHDAGAIASSSR